ncbi:hypothetical protein M378DRAFT_174312, partial [Amanita muscaria Koide BX008]
FTKVKEAGLGDERPKQELDSEHASTWTDVGSGATSQPSAENEAGGSITLTPNVESSPLDVASTDAATLVSERPEQRHVDAHSSSNKPTSGALGNGGSDVPSSVFPGNVSDMNSGSSENARECLNFIEELTSKNCHLVSVEIMQWVNTKDIHTLHQITRLIVEKAIEAPNDRQCEHDHLCKAMVKYTQTFHQMTRLIVEKAMEEPRRILACARLCSMMVKDADGGVTVDGPLFGKYLDEICQENPEASAASVACDGERTARIRRLRLIKFIGALVNNNVDLVSVEIRQWANTKDTQSLHQITWLIVEKAIKAPQNPNPFDGDPFAHDPFARLCKAMVKHTQTLHQITRLIVEKAMEVPHQFYACAQLCNMMIKDTNGKVSGNGLFGEYLGEICQENLEAIAASVTAAGEHMARIRRLRLIDFIGALVNGIWAPAIIDKWVTTLLDANDEEKVVTLCMAMTRAGRLCTSRSTTNSWLQRVKNVAQETSKPRVRKLLQEVTKRGSVIWVVAEPSKDYTEQ